MRSMLSAFTLLSLTTGVLAVITTIDLMQDAAQSVAYAIERAR